MTASGPSRGKRPLALLLLLLAASCSPAQISGTLPGRASSPRDFARWEKEIAAFEAMDRMEAPSKGGVLFIGSSVIRLWETLAADYPGHPVINRGFGGSEIADSAHFADRIILPCEPKVIFLRAGGNDIHNGRLPAEVAADFAEFVRVVRERLPTTLIYYIEVCPTPSRWGEADKYRDLNARIRKLALEMPFVAVVDAFGMSLTPEGRIRGELFVADRQHFTPEGYRLLAEAVRPFLP